MPRTLLSLLSFVAFCFTLPAADTITGPLSVAQPKLWRVEVESSFLKDGTCNGFLINGYFQRALTTTLPPEMTLLDPVGAVQIDPKLTPARSVTVLVDGKPVKLTYAQLRDAMIDALNQEWAALPESAKHKPQP